MDDNPGMSLFQNSHFDAVKSNTPAPEEIEAEQDQMRYQQELKQILEDEFEDLADINSSINSSYSISTNGYHHNALEKKSRRLNGHILPSLSNGSENYRYKSKDYSSLEQLEVLYQVRLREIEKLRDENKTLQEQYRKEKCDLTATISQLRSEKDNMIVSHNEVQKMLVERTSRLSEAERELNNFREKWSESEKIKSNALHELEMNKITIRELEKRLMAAEKNSYKNEEKNFDNLLKELTSKNKREISDLQREIHSLNNKIMTKEIDYAKLEQQLIDTQRSHETVLSEKTKLIEKLNSNLAECHSRYQSLLMDKKNSDVSHLLREIQQKTREIDGFKSEIVLLKEKIVHFENISKNLQSAVPERMRKRSLSPVSHSEMVKLKKELQNAMDNLKFKQTENETLREKFFSVSKEVETLRRNEIDHSSEIEALKTEKENLLTDLTKNQKEQEMLKITFMDYITKSDILHQEQISDLELASSKKVLEVEAKMKEFEVRFKDDAMKAFTEEVNEITNIYSNHFGKLNVAVEQLQKGLDEKNSQIRQMAAKIERLKDESERIYGKYRNARKIAVALKQITEDRTQLLRRHHKQFVQTLNEIQKYLDNALVCKTKETDKLTELIEKSAKNTKNVDELLGNDEMDAMLFDINKKLMCSV